MPSERSDPPELPREPWTGLPAGAAAAIRPVLPRLTEEIIDTIRREVPAYRRPLEGNFGIGVRIGVEEALAEFTELIENPGLDRAPRREVYVGLGRGEAREGRSLEALLAAYRVGARVAWRTTAGAGLEAGLEPQTLALLAESIFAYIDALSAMSAEGFAEAQIQAAGELDRQRRRLVTLLISDPPPEAKTIEEAAREARWERPRLVSALAVRQASSRLLSRLPGQTPAARIDGDLQCVLVGDPLAPGREAELERAIGETAAGIGPAVDPGELGRSWRRARAALAIAERDGGGLVFAERRLAELALIEGADLLEALAEQRLAPLDAETDASRKRLTETLRCWLDLQGSVPAVAEALHVHPQTVRYRLARLRECFGEQLEDADFRFELALVLRGTRRSVE